MINRRVLIGLGIICILLSAGQNVAAPTTVKSQAKSPIKVAVVMNLSPSWTIGDLVLDGIKSAAALARADGMQLEVKTYNTGEDLIGARTKLEEALQTKPDLIIGDLASNRALVQADLAETAKQVIMFPYASADALTERRQYTFRACFKNQTLGREIARFAKQSLQAKTAMIGYNNGSVHQTTVKNAFEQEMNQTGQVVGKVLFLPEVRNYTKQATNIKELNPDVFFTPVGDAHGFHLIERLMHVGSQQVAVIGGDSWEAPPFKLKLAKLKPSFPIYWVSHAPEQFTAATHQQIAKTYELQTGKRWGTPQSLGFDSLMLLVEAHRHTGSSTPSQQELANAMRDKVDYQGFTGQIRFNSTQDPQKSPFIKQFLKAGGQRDVQPKVGH